MAEKVEIGFDLSGSPDYSFAVLDDPVKGILNSATYVLGGALLIDVTDKVLSYSVNRGKSRQLDRYPAGKAAVVFDNNDRTFDPVYTGSPYYGQIIPRREVRISTDGVTNFSGTIDDWNMDYQPAGVSTSSITCSDSLINLANAVLTGGTATSQLTGARINAILDSPDVNWSSEYRAIDTGVQTLQADVIPGETNALSYLQLVTDSEPGDLYMSKSGYLTFIDSTPSDPGAGITLSDTGSGIPYTGMAVVYGSEQLYNTVIVSRLNGGTVSSTNTDSQLAYGISSITIEDLLMSTDLAAQALADDLLATYSEPEYRFESVEVELNSLTEAQRAQVLALDMGVICTVVFTPNGIAPAISKVAKLIGISHTVSTSSHKVTLNFAASATGFFTLGDSVFGRLSEGNSLA